MPENQIIAASLRVDSDDAVKNVLRLKGEVAALQKEFNSAEAGSDVQLKAFKKLKSAQDELGNASKALGGNFKNIKEHLVSLPGPANQLTGSLGGVNQAFNILKANPIIGVFALLAGLVVALFDKFRKMEGVSDSLGKAWGTLSGLFSTFLNKILTPLIDAFTFFVDLFTSAATFIAGIFSPGLAEASERTGELTEALDDLNDAEAQSAITRAESNRKLQEAREIADDANIPIKDRIKALKEAGRIEKEEFDNSIRIATERAKIMLEQIGIELGVRGELIEAIRNGSIEQLKAARNEIFALKNVDKEKIKAIDALIIQVENEGAARARVSKKTESQITGLEKEEAAKRKEARDKANADAKAARDKAAAQQKADAQKLAEFENKLRQLQQQNDLLAIKDGYDKEIAQLEIKLANEKRLNEQAIKEGKLSRQQANQLNAELIKQFDLERDAITEKHNKEVADKETAFQKELSDISLKTRLAGIKEIGGAEVEQLKSSLAEKTALIISGIEDEFNTRRAAITRNSDEEKRQNAQDFRDKKITREQLQKLNSELDTKLNADKIKLQQDFNAERFKVEKQAQDELNEFIKTSNIQGITDSQRAEILQLRIGYEEKLQDAIKRYKDDSVRLSQIKIALNNQLIAQEAEAERKFRKENAEKALEDSLKKEDKILNDPEAELNAKKLALDSEQVLIQKAFDDKILTEEAYTAKSVELAEKRNKVAQLETEFRKRQAEELGGTLMALAELVGKQTIAGKALGIATALINTYQGASEALKQKSTLPSPLDVVAKVVNVATVIATGLKTVKSIAAVQVPGGGGGGSAASAAPSASTVTPVAPISPAQQSTKVIQSDAGNAAAGGVDRVIRAYVVDADVQGSADRNARLNRAARLGG
jgi:hypothetical protein